MTAAFVNEAAASEFTNVNVAGRLFSKHLQLQLDPTNTKAVKLKFWISVNAVDDVVALAPVTGTPSFNTMRNNYRSKKIHLDKIYQGVWVNLKILKLNGNEVSYSLCFYAASW